MSSPSFILFLFPSSSDGGWLMTPAEEGKQDDALPPVTLQPLPSQPWPPHRGSSAVTLGISSISPGQRTSMFSCCTPPYPP
uniref:Secreted protein n=1 Tax=Triticum urartu TaxID=4572 RepID=A0A8R7UD81_TRIUA